jgi:hypothetical protein
VVAEALLRSAEMPLLAQLVVTEAPELHPQFLVPVLPTPVAGEGGRKVELPELAALAVAAMEPTTETRAAQAQPTLVVEAVQVARCLMGQVGQAALA